MKLFLPLLLCVLLTGCTAAALDRATPLVDAAALSAANLSDRIMTRIDETEESIERLQARLKRLRCLSFPAMKRYARRSEENRALILRDCGVDFVTLEATVLPPS